MERDTDLVALGHPGNEHFAGLEQIPNPGVARVEMRSDELAAVCPITGQPDLYVVAIEFRPRAHCLESKSLKLYLNGFREPGRVRRGARGHDPRRRRRRARAAARAT